MRPRLVTFDRWLRATLLKNGEESLASVYAPQQDANASTVVLRLLLEQEEGSRGRIERGLESLNDGSVAGLCDMLASSCSTLCVTVHFKLLAQPHRQYQTFSSQAQRLCFDTAFERIRSRLAFMSTLSVWTHVEEVCVALHLLVAANLKCTLQMQPHQIEDGVTSMPVFSASPMAYVSEIGEHLFMLPQQIQPFQVRARRGG